MLRLIFRRLVVGILVAFTVMTLAFMARAKGPSRARIVMRRTGTPG